MSGAHSDFPVDLPGLPVTALQIHNAKIYISVTVSLFALAVLLLATRLVSRWRSPTGIAADDYFVTVAAVSRSPPIFGRRQPANSSTWNAQALELIDIALIVATVSANLAIPAPEYMPFTIIGKNAPLTMTAEVFTSWSVAMVKTSIALMLVRFQQSKAWSRFFHAIIALQILTAVFVTIVQSTRCIPTEAVWNPHIIEKWCWSPDGYKITMTVASSIVIITDVIFALIPLTFLHHIRRSLPHRVIIGLLMSLGLFASAASVVKTIMVHRFDISGDTAGNGISIALWASLEAIIGIIAACIPCLRAAFLRLLSRLGIYTEFANAMDRSSTWATVVPPSDGDCKFEPESGRADLGASDGSGILDETGVQLGNLSKEHVQPSRTENAPWARA